MDRQALSRVLVENSQHPQLTASLSAGFEKVVGPDLVLVTGTPELPGRVTEPSFPNFSSGQLESLLSPNAVDPLTIDAIAVVLQHRRDDPIAIHRLFMGILPNERNRRRFIRPWMASVARGGAMQPH